jgi:hypothetical protein
MTQLGLSIVFAAAWLVLATPAAAQTFGDRPSAARRMTSY